MALFKFFLFTVLLLVAIVQADHNRTGFLNIDCGSSKSSYTDESTGFVYLSDANFVKTGENREIADAYKAQLVNQTQLLTVRSFPQGTRNCYTLKLTLGRATDYMIIRARFLYGDYDNKGKLPTFDLYLGDDLWATVVFPVAWVPVDKEIVFVPRDDIRVCLVNTGFGTPFISALEVRPWGSKTNVSETEPLQPDVNPLLPQILRFAKYLNPCLKNSAFCEKNETKFVLPTALVVGCVVLLASASGLFWWQKKRSPLNIKDKSRGLIYSNMNEFKYSDIKRMTNNFEIRLDQGGFGSVYFGSLNNGNRVAVKMISTDTNFAQQQCHAELKLLLTVHHRSLITLVGYCDDGPAHLALIYEYMAMGNLGSHLSGESSTILSWEDRLRIAIDTAQGLDYLHTSCKSKIVHRDVKPGNILLTENLHAKLCHFGLSKTFPDEVQNDDRHLSDDVSGVSTIVAGTHGYVDPEYFASNLLSEKSDVYSFGIVLLEIITGQPVIDSTREHDHIVTRVSTSVSRRDIEQIIDPRIEGVYNVNAAWKVVELAMSCAASSSRDRPIMNRVVIELKDCLRTELSTRNEFSEAVSRHSSSFEMASVGTVSGDMISELNH